MSAPSETHLLDPNKNVVVPIRDVLDDYVNTAEFDIICSHKARELARVLSSDDSDSSDAPDILGSGSDNIYTATHQVSKLEAYFYYTGISPKGWPTLVWRDSTDIFEVATGPYMYVRRMRLAHVPDDHEFGQNGLWENVRDWVVEFLTGENVSISSVDFVRFTWRNKREDPEINSEEEEEAAGEEAEDGAEGNDEDHEDTYDSLAPIKHIEDGDRYFTNPTIWIGVLPETLTSPRAFELGQKIRAFLDELEVKEVDIAFRESIAQSFAGNRSALYAPVEFSDPLAEFIDNVSVALSLPIAGRKTSMQGSLGPYFQHNDKLYAITTRHNLFLANDGNAPYKYNASASKREVAVMGNSAFTNYRNSIQARIGNLNYTVKSLDRQITLLTERVRNGIGLPETQHLLDEHEAKLRQTNRKISNLKQFFVTLSKRWIKFSDRTIGHIVWSPSIGVGVGPNRFTRDVCVVELYKPSFKHFIGNVLSIGPKYSEVDLKALMNEQIDVLPDFKYPDNGLLTLGGMFTAEQVNNPNSLDSYGDRTQHVLKNGFTTGTTVGTLSRFMSFVRKYFTAGALESLELAILPHENETDTFFSKGGDSGAPIVSGIGEFVGLLTSGTKKDTDGSDITFATPFHYIWDLILEEFPGANLCQGDIPALLTYQ